MIQKLIYRGRTHSTKIQHTINNMWCNKKLSFFLTKRKFFLFKNKAPVVGSKENNESFYKGSNKFFGTVLQNLLTRLRSDKALLQSSKRKFLFYKIKRNFQKTNKQAREHFFNITKIKMGHKNRTVFFLKSKNVSKLSLLTHNKGLPNRDSSLLGFFIKKNTKELVANVHNSNRNGLSELVISRNIQIFILSNNQQVAKRKKQLPNYSKIERTLDKEHLLKQKTRFEKTRDNGRVFNLIDAKYDITTPDRGIGQQEPKDFLVKKAGELVGRVKKLQSFLRWKPRYKNIRRRLPNKLESNLTKKHLTVVRGRGIKGKQGPVIYANRNTTPIRNYMYHPGPKKRKAWRIANMGYRLVTNYEIPVDFSERQPGLYSRSTRRSFRIFKKKYRRLGRRMLLKTHNFSKQYLRLKTNHNKNKFLKKKIKNTAALTHTGYLFTDSRQLLNFSYGNITKLRETNPILLKVNLFNFRSYNWGIIT